MIEQLRQATRTQHAALDQYIYPIIQSVRKPDEYARLLSMFYGYFQPVYQQLEIHIDKTILPDYDRRRKPSAIMHDLDQLGFARSLNELCNEVPSINSSEKAFGALYVLEGSTMGGKIISKKLKENSGLGDECFLFFNAYGELNPRMWGIFIESLSNPALIEKSATIIISAAETFSHFHKWVTYFYPAGELHTNETIKA